MAPARGEAPIESLIARRRLEDIAAQLGRSLLPIVATDTLVAYLIHRHGMTGAAIAWWVAIVAWTTHRRLTLGRWQNPPDASLMATLQRMRWMAGALGLLRAVPVVLLFAGADEATRLLVSMVMIGLAAGAMATCGGDRLTMLYWGTPVFGALAVGWFWQATPAAVLLAVLLLYLFRVLLAYVELLGRQSAQLIEAAGQLRIERDRASSASDAKTRFLAAASHDLRQPLYALGLYAATLDELAMQIGDARLQPVRQGIRRALEHSRTLLESLLDISKLEALAVEVKPQRIELEDFLRSIVNGYAAQASEKGLTLALDVAPLLQRCAVHSDPVLLARLIGNLLDNAVKFTERGGVTVVVGHGTTAERVRIDVRDTGPGIVASEQRRVFEEFYQIGNPGRDRSQGLGLGLSIVARLAALLDTEVELRSAPGQGVCFRLELGPALPQLSWPMSARRVDAGAAPRPLAGRVLVIDDEADIRDGLIGLLTLRGWTVLAAAGSDDALSLMKSEPVPDVLLVDYRLGGGETGIQAIERLHRVTGPVPAVLVTGDTAPERIVESGEAGYPVLHKPIGPQAVIEALQEAMADPVHRGMGSAHRR